MNSKTQPRTSQPKAAFPPAGNVTATRNQQYVISYKERCELKEVRCNDCDRLLAKAIGVVEAKCRCGCVTSKKIAV